ncbi:MAG TPA: arylamine N-acetyltransferase [Casimicrobiaceae bacterium]|nr:arylamine N-acetyltransferase [Casimicrobiaceae bacterium]
MSNEKALDLDAYLRRIGWTGSRAPTYATLAGMLHAHVRRIPFENLDVLLGRGIALDLRALQSKLVADRRGGYCFEHATLFAAVLEALGYAPVRHSARVVLVSPRTDVPRTHMFLTIALPEGTFVLDPGFGGLAPDAPVPLVDTDPPEDASHWMARDGDWWVLRARTAGKVVDCWATTLEVDNAIDFVVANHYTATHPASAFRNRLLLRAFAGDARVSVMNRSVTIADAATSSTRELADRRELRMLLVRHFGFDLPEVESLRVPSIEAWQ